MTHPSPRQRLLLHACCAPCATVPLERLADQFDITVFFYGPNIHPQEEYQLRLADQRRLCQNLGVELIEAAYRPAEWGRAILPFRTLAEGSARCQACFRLRMKATALLARKRFRRLHCDFDRQPPQELEAADPNRQPSRR